MFHNIDLFCYIGLYSLEVEEYDKLKELAEKSGLDIPQFIKNYLGIMLRNLELIVTSGSKVVDESGGCGDTKTDSGV